MFIKIEQNVWLNKDISAFYDEDRLFFLGIMLRSGDLNVTQQDIKELEESRPFIAEKKPDYVLLIWRDHNETKAVFFSRTSRVRPVEFLNGIFSDMGLVKGDKKRAVARISQPLLWSRLQEENETDLGAYVRKRTDMYFTECDWIEACAYANEHGKEIREWPMYQKKKVPWSFVRSVDIAPKGSTLYVRSLENEAGLSVESGEDTIIMIGSEGEVYHIESKKFEDTYEATDEPLDIFANMTLFLPEVRIMPEGEYIAIDEMAHICYPKPGNAIFAKQIQKRTKVFPKYSPEEYFLGKPGDYIVSREDDPSDIYIVQQKIFEHTYEKTS